MFFENLTRFIGVLYGLGMKTETTLNALYSFPGFRALSKLKGVLGDPKARVIVLDRRQKKRPAHVVTLAGVSMTAFITRSGTWTPAACASTSDLSTAAYPAGSAKL